MSIYININQEESGARMHIMSSPYEQCGMFLDLSKSDIDILIGRLEQVKNDIEHYKENTICKGCENTVKNCDCPPF